ncbi:ctenidin-1-like isoform X3 [Melitaea cinxia]|uniref:ctenidin-1-like isoform X3 n=1 Tax=Melitaea cinxia TaxID=113334 RepID=UPI001E270621|nr:ctenidin-1-like isoform X3 [Melitaea cinxia]
MTRIAIVYVALVVFAMVQATPDGNSGGGVVEGGVGGGSGLGSGDGLGSGGGGGLGGGISVGVFPLIKAKVNMDATFGTTLEHDGRQCYVTI